MNLLDFVMELAELVHMHISQLEPFAEEQPLFVNLMQHAQETAQTVLLIRTRIIDMFVDIAMALVWKMQDAPDTVLLVQTM